MLARFFIVLGSIFALAAAALLLSSADLPAQVSVKSRQDSWRIEQPAFVESDAALSVIMKSRLWGAGPTQALTLPADEKALTAADWRLSGVYIVGGQRIAMLSVAGKPDQVLKVGDKLPGDAKILAISTDSICLLLNGKRVSLSTYQE